MSMSKVIAQAHFAPLGHGMGFAIILLSFCAVKRKLVRRSDQRLAWFVAKEIEISVYGRQNKAA